jgi:hypothetical protein
MTIAHGPRWALFVSHQAHDSEEFGVCFYPVVTDNTEEAIGGAKVVEVAFVARPDANNWVNEIQLNGLNLLHEPGYEMVLAALRKICEDPA